MERSLQTLTVLHPLQWPALRVDYTEQPSLSPVTPKLYPAANPSGAGPSDPAPLASAPFVSFPNKF